MKHKLFTLFIALVASVGTMFAESGTCGENLTWDLTDGVLTISGTGDMYNYTYDDGYNTLNTPWFSYIASIKSLIINEGVTSIGEWAFSFCTSITSIEIPNSVTSIGFVAFAGCEGLTSVTIPNSVTSIGQQAFYSCGSLPIYDNIRYADTYLVEATDKTLSSYSIKEGTKWIGYRAFSGCKNLTSVTIPNSVTSIDYAAFSDCTGLTSVTIPNSVTSIGYNAFYNCSNLNALYIHDIAAWCKISFSESGGANPLKYAHNLYLNGELVTNLVIPNSVASIGNYAFYGCKSLTSIEIPNSVTSIGNSAFNGCSGLTAIKIPNSVTSIEGGTFSSCSGLTSVTIPNSVTSIGDRAFYYCESLTSIEIPNSVASIGEWAFNGCKGLTSIEIPNKVSTISKGTFSSCSGLTSLTIPKSVTSIGENAFYGCNGLTTVTIPNSVTSIGSSAFYKCTGLTTLLINDVAAWCNIAFEDYIANPLYYAQNFYLNGKLVTYLDIPNSVTSIGNYSFYNCKSLISVTIPSSVTDIGSNAFYNVLNIVYDGSATGSPWGAKNVNRFAEGWFLYSDNTKTTLLTCSENACGEISIPNSVTSIGEKAFYNCKNLTSVTIPNSVTSIGDNAFYGCNGLTSITIPNSVTSIGKSAFYNIPNIVYNGSATGSPWGARNVNGFVEDWFVYSDNTKTTLLICSENASGEISIPNSVTSIGEKAFYNCKNLTSVTIPNSVTSIGDNAFSGCSGLTSYLYNKHVFAYMPDTYAGAYIIPEGIGSIAGFAFSGCTGLTSITIPNSVASIGNYAFSSCKSLTSVTIPNSVTTINMGAFNGCKGLTSIEISNNVTYIGEYAFQNCTSLTSIEIPNSVTSIGSSAFQYCTDLTSVTIGNSVTIIGSSAFFKCSSLRNIYSKRFTPPTISSNTFSNIHSQATVHVPFGASNTYRNADYWKDMTIEGPQIPYDVMKMATSCSISFNVEDREIASVGIKDGETFDGNILEYIGLEPNSEYKDVPVVLTSNTGETETVNVSFSTTALELTTQASVPVSEKVAILLAETNMADIETSCGFEWKRNDMPDDYVGNKVFCPVANGSMAGRLKNLKDDVLYKYRAFYQSAAGNMYYGDWQYIFTGDVAVEFDPILYTYAAALIKEREATLKGYALAGSTDFTEQGFEYWAESRAPLPNAPRRLKSALGERHTVTATGISMRVSLSDLDPGTTYRYRTYAKIGDQVLYGSEMTFTTQGEFTYAIKFVNWDGEELQTLHVAENAVPEYTGETPVRPDDEQFTYTFSGWTPEITAATADATYTATFKATEIKPEALDQITNDQSTTAAKIFRDGQLYIIRGDNTYTLTGQEVK